ncbi:vitellogenin-like [Apis dorsata]|uniref:vitellogenin-like n=1 Tax=Apis dorsata TaxID=7462 RepID=UPI0012932D70|nr:vitellogenin-like [Apis dorsata]XP_031366124.1 vitellogenin-like [Apis dorsata]
MLIIILPYLLATRVPGRENAYHDDSDWQRYGPECTYDVLVNMSLSNIVHDEDTICSMIASELKCRTKGSDTLNCHFSNGRIVRPDPKNERCSNARNFVPIGDRFVDEEPFEIRFNARGIENLVVSRDIARWRLDMMRAIVGQLNIGFELTAEKEHDRFLTMENSSIGYCEVEVKVSRAGYGEESDEKFEIMLEPERAGMVPLSRGSIRIEKVRYPKRCPNRKIYFFGNHEDFSFGRRDIFMDMTTSVSRIYISRKGIISFTESTGVMRTLNRPRTMNLHQKINLSLKSINFARIPIREIVNPASTSLYAYTNLERIPEYK